MLDTPLTAGELAMLACLCEAIVAKPGNVHRGADFEDLQFGDFAISAALIGEPLNRAADGIGDAVLAAVRRVQRWTARNTNLGMLLLLAPLAAVPRQRPLFEGVADVLGRLSPQDARQIYAAIREAQPGGLGRVDQHDIRDAPPSDLLDAMRAAADRDDVARQYANGFQEVRILAERLRADLGRGLPFPDAVVAAHVWQMAHLPDSLIRRKCGQDVAVDAQRRAAQVLECGEPSSGEYWSAVADLDFWLRCDGHRRNPGTTADLVCAAVFATFREHPLPLPLRWSPASP